MHASMVRKYLIEGLSMNLKLSKCIHHPTALRAQEGYLHHARLVCRRMMSLMLLALMKNC